MRRSRRVRRSEDSSVIRPHKFRLSLAKALLFTRTTMLRPFTRYDRPENIVSAPGSAMSDGLGREVSTALAHCLAGIIGTAMSKASQYMFIIT